MIFQLKQLQVKKKSLKDYEGKALLIVNVASKCGFTPQYKGLQEVYDKYKEQGLEILGFPCNQFGGQEPGTEADITSFCELNYGVNFPMFAKIDVKGDKAHPSVYIHDRTSTRLTRYESSKMELYKISNWKRRKSSRAFCTANEAGGFRG